MTTTRRVFLRALGATGVAAACVGATGCAGNGITSAPESAANVPTGLSFASDGSPVVIGRDAGGLYAMSSICTHASCDMTQQGAVKPTEVDCSCHGSAFDVNGTPIGGPAFSPLPHFQVTIASDGTFTVDENTVVSASTRAPIAAGGKSG